MLSLLPHPKSCGNRYRCLVTSLEAVDFIELKFILMQGLTYLFSLIICIGNQKGNESMFTKTIIFKAPSGKFIFVGRVHESLINKSYDTIEDAKVAAVDCQLEIGEMFPVAIG